TFTRNAFVSYPPVNPDTFTLSLHDALPIFHGDALQNSGTFQVATGTVSLLGGGSSSGALVVSPGATFSVDVNTFVLSAGASVGDVGRAHVCTPATSLDPMPSPA